MCSTWSFLPPGLVPLPSFFLYTTTSHFVFLSLSLCSPSFLLLLFLFLFRPFSCTRQPPSLSGSHSFSLSSFLASFLLLPTLVHSRLQFRHSEDRKKMCATPAFTARLDLWARVFIYLIIYLTFCSAGDPSLCLWLSSNNYQTGEKKMMERKSEAINPI